MKTREPRSRCLWGRTTFGPQTANRARPRRRRARTTRRPVWVRMRTLKPETRLRLRLVPSKVRLVMILNIQQGILSVRRPLNLGPRALPGPDGLGVDLNQPAAEIAGNRQLAWGLGKGIELGHGSGVGVEHVHIEANGVLFGNGCVGKDVD